MRLLSDAFGDSVLVGAGTVTNVEQVRHVAAAGGRLIVMPHGDPAVLRAAKGLGSRAFPASRPPPRDSPPWPNGADALKLFPDELLSPVVLRAMPSVIPAETRFLPVGAITPHTMGEYVAAGAAGFGLGSALYKRGDAERTLARCRVASTQARRRQFYVMSTAL